MAKLLENIFRAVNIALVNELKMVCDRDGHRRLGGDRRRRDQAVRLHAVLSGPGPRRPLHPDRSVLPDVEGARVRRCTREFIELAGEINTQMPGYYVGKVAQALNAVAWRSTAARVLLLGVAYKADVDDMRESPALRIIELLRAEGAEVSYHDPHVPTLARQGLASAELDERVLREHDVSVVVTAHDGIDWAIVAREAPLVVDLRNVFPEGDGKVWRL